jgi:hypothetical protein
VIKKHGHRYVNTVYENDYGLKRLFLHSWKLKINIPSLEINLDLESKLPQDLLDVAIRLGLPPEKQRLFL